MPSFGGDVSGAEEAGRVVVVTSDHGHVVDAGTESRNLGQSDRWRPDDRQPAEDEVVLAGRRVAAQHGGRIIAPWSERVRFGMKKNGYHGGASPQEVVVPLGVFGAPDVAIEGWEATGIRYPQWWETTAPVAKDLGAEPPPPPRRRGAKLQEDLPFFKPGAAAQAPAVAWIEALLRSDTFAAQKTAAARMLPPDDKVQAFLRALDERGRKLTRAALAQKLGLPPVRVQTVVAAMRRLLNVDGYDVLSIDETSDSLELNLELLKTQFELDV